MLSSACLPNKLQAFLMLLISQYSQDLLFMAGMERLQRVLQARTMGGEAPNADHEQVDTAEQVYISSLALLKMLKHGEAFRT